MPTDRELDALKVLWGRGPSTVREVWDALGEPDTAYTTVLSLFQTMDRKGLVTKAREGRAHRYAAAAPRTRTLRALTRRLLDAAFDGAVDEYVLHALDARRPSLEEIERLEAKLAEAKARARKARPRAPRRK